MNNFYITDVVKHLLIINVLVYLGTSYLMDSPSQAELGFLINNATPENFDSLGRLRYAVFYPTSPYFHSYQVVTYMFMHGGTAHIFFNMYALYMFGTAVETVWGPKKFLFFYLFTGFGALALQLIVQAIEFNYFGANPAGANVPMLGASGAVFGILAAYGMQFPNNVLRLLIPPISLKAKYFVLIYAAIEIGLGLSPFKTGVAHFAHVGGALFGFLLIMFWRKRGDRMY